MQCAGILYDVSEKQGDQRGEAVETRALCQAQDHACALEFSKHHGIFVVAGETQTEAQGGVQSVWLHRHTQHAHTGPDQDCHHLLCQALD